MPCKSTLSTLGWAGFLLVGFGLLRCGTQDPPVEDYLKLELNDSLSLFDSVNIVLANPSDTSQVYQVIWEGPLPDPSNMPEIRLDIPANLRYLVRVRAWDAERNLGWEMVIVEIAGKSQAIRTALPPISPYLVDLSEITVSNGRLDPAFQPGRTVYNLVLGFLDSLVSLRAKPADSRATVSMIQGAKVTEMSNIDLQVAEGSSDLTVQVTNTGGRLAKYLIHVLRPNIPEPRLRKFKPAQGSLNPSFSPEHFSYSLSLPEKSYRLAMTEIETDTFSTLVFNGDTLAKGQKPNSMTLKEGLNKADIQVFVGPKSKSYALAVTVAESTTPHDSEAVREPRLLALSLATGTLSPLFNDLTYDYRVEVGFEVDRLEFLKLSPDSGQIAVVAGDTLAGGALPSSIPLEVGENDCEIKVLNSSSQAATYTVHVTRKDKFSLAGFRYSAKIRMNTTERGGARITSPVYDFPLLLRLRDTHFDFSQFRGHGQDLRIVKADGSFLPYEIESWDSAGSAADIWIKTDTIQPNAFQDLAYICWGNDTAAPLSNGSGVFQPAQGFASVWHMNPEWGDATGNGNVGIPSNAPGSLTGGIAGSRLNCNGFSQGVNFGNRTSLSGLRNSIQIEAWIRTSQNKVTASVIRQEQHFIPLRLKESGGAESIVYHNFKDTSDLKDSTKILNMPWATETDSLNDGEWHQIVAQYDAEFGLFVYWDGVLKTSSSKFLGPLHAAVKPFMVGVTETGTESFKGDIDEVRVQGQTRSSDWISLNYATQRNAVQAVGIVR